MYIRDQHILLARIKLLRMSERIVLEKYQLLKVKAVRQFHLKSAMLHLASFFKKNAYFFVEEYSFDKYNCLIDYLLNRWIYFVFSTSEK